MHDDPFFPDLEPRQRYRIEGVLIFFEGDQEPFTDFFPSVSVEFFQRLKHGDRIFDRHVALDVVDCVKNESAVAAEDFAVI